MINKNPSNLIFGMIKILYNLLRITYINRYRRLYYSDKSRFYILFGIFAISYYQLWTEDFEYKTILVNIFLFTNIITLLQRKDYLFLKKNINSFFLHIFICTDILIWTFPLLSFLLIFDVYSFIINISIILFSPFMLKIKGVNLNRIETFSTKDPIWIIHLRAKPWEYVILIFSLFLQYQGLKYSNKGLYIFGLYTISLLIIQIYNQDEKLYFYKFSKKKRYYILLDLFICNITNYLFLFIPSLVLAVFFHNLDFLDTIFYVTFSITPFFWIRYLFFNDSLLRILSSYFLIFILYGISQHFYSFFIILFVNILLYYFSIKKFNKLIG